MQLIKTHLKRFYIYLFILFIAISSAQASQNCEDFLRANYAQAIQEIKTQRQELTQIYENFVGKNSNLNFKFGFESEYTLNSWASRLLNYYGPGASMGFSAAQWLALAPKDKNTKDARVEWIKNNLDKLFGSKKSLGNVVLLRPDQSPGFLPKELILDYTGNLEVILNPVESFHDWQSRVQWILRELGAGSMQSTLGVPRAQFFAGQSPQQVLHSNVGYLQFMSDLDVLMKLQQGFEKYLEDKNKAAASAFQHPFLGPLTQLKRVYLNSVFIDNLKGIWDKETLKNVGFDDDSFKYIGSTSYRPDLGAPDYVVLEVRDAHSSFEILEEKLMRSMFYFSFPREIFAPFYHIAAFDSVQTFAALPQHIQQMLSELFPAKEAQDGESYTEDEIIANEVFRNFSFPLRNWTGYLSALGASDSLGQLEQAQRRYLNELKKISKQIKSGEMDAKSAQLEVQGALARFSVESGLLQIMINWLYTQTKGFKLSFVFPEAIDFKLAS